jgi:hypothetical protein
VERSSLYALPVARSFSNPPVATTAQTAPPPEPRPAPPMSRTQAVQPQIDVARLSEDVYQHIQRRMRIERERRGL